MLQTCQTCNTAVQVISDISLLVQVLISRAPWNPVTEGIYWRAQIPKQAPSTSLPCSRLIKGFLFNGYTSPLQHHSYVQEAEQIELQWSQFSIPRTITFYSYLFVHLVSLLDKRISYWLGRVFVILEVPLFIRSFGTVSVTYWNIYSSFPRNYTKLAMLSLLYCFVVWGQLVWAKGLPPVGIEPAEPTP